MKPYGMRGMGLAERILELSIPEPMSGCWLWLGCVKPDSGYAVMHPPGSRKSVYGHRIAYEAFRSQIPSGLQIDHLCRVRSCVNPAHMEPVTLTENLRRGYSPAACNSRKQACVRGHRFTAKNTYRRASGSRSCRRCAAACQHARRSRRVAS